MRLLVIEVLVPLFISCLRLNLATGKKPLTSTVMFSASSAQNKKEGFD